jgi:hypothetical protein
MSRYGVLLNQPASEPGKQPESEPRGTQAEPAAPKRSPRKATSGTKNQSANQPASQLASRLAKQPAARPNPGDNRITFKGFYITERLDRRLTEAVRYYQDVHGIKKVDRSILLNAMLDDDRWTDDELDQLVERVVSQLTARLTG